MLVNSISRSLRALVLALTISQSAFAAAPLCEGIFAPDIPTRAVDFGLGRLETSPGIYTPIELIQYQNTKAKLSSALDSLDRVRKQSVEHLLAAVEFFDYTHTAAKLLPNFLDGKRQNFDFTNIYDGINEPEGAPFDGFLGARNYLKNTRPELGPSLLTELHKRLMAQGVEGVTPDKLGKWRSSHMVGNAVGTARLTPEEVSTINSNPYLYFEESAKEPGSLNESLWKKVKIWGRYKDMALASGDFTLSSGKIHYPHITTKKTETLELIRNSHPDIYNEILAFKVSREGKSQAELEAKFTKALTEERFARFLRDRAALGPIQLGKNENDFINLVADFQRDLVAIHPLANGNGRTTRMLMNYLLTSEGLPAVRLVDPYLDVQVSKTDWREYVLKGVVNNAQLYADVLYRIQNGLVVEYSPELLYPGLPETVDIALKKQNSNKAIDNYKTIKVDGDQFNAFVKSMMELYPELRQEIINDRLRAMSRMADLFVEYYRSKHIQYIHDKDGERLISVQLIDPDFIALFGQNRSANKALWDEKINRWYDRDMLIWRGLANKVQEHSINDILNYFKSVTPHLVSNMSLRNMRNKSLIDAVKDDFATYNREALTGDLVQMADDHHKTGPRYRTSYGYSTSKREVVGKAFAMGAMVIAEYGKQNDPALQGQLKSRINIASYRGLKDIDLGRLKAFDPEFAYIYGRQAEVMGIGGTDPDAVMLVQKINAEGHVTQTFLRNTDKPNEILLIEGRYVPGEGPLPVDKIKQRFIIQQ